MALPVDQQLKYWGVVAVVTGALLWGLGNTLTPFVVGAAIAYFLDPVADRLERLGLSRALSTALITLAALLFFTLVALLVIPALIRQLTAALQALPNAIEMGRSVIEERFPELLDDNSVVRQAADKAIALLQERAGSLATSLLSSVNALLSLVLFVVIVPIVAFYLLLDWDRMIARVDALLPRDHAPKIRAIARDIDRTLANFIRGQGTVMLILGSFYAIGLMLLGLQFGLVIGVIAGVVSFIPYVGAIVGGVLSIGVAIVQFWSVDCVGPENAAALTEGVVACSFWTSRWMIAMVAGVFMIGKVFEDNILTPLLVGGSVGLHPVWLMLGLTVFGSLFGFIGLLIAVPLAAMFGVLVRYGIGEYLTSRLYLGLEALKRDRSDG